MWLGEKEARNDIANGAVVDGDGGGFDDLDVWEIIGGEAEGETVHDQVGRIDAVVAE